MKKEQIDTLLGAKMYCIDRGEIEVIRITNIIKGICTIKNLKTGEINKLEPDYILRNYTKLINDGVIVFAIVETCSDHEKGIMVPDVVIMGYTAEGFKNNRPDVICRQNIIDIFQNIYNASYKKNDPNDKTIVGTSLTRNCVPQGMNMEMLAQCDKITYIATYNTYLTDSVDFIIDEVMSAKKRRKFDEVLENCLSEYLKATKIPDIGQKHVKGHCRDLKTLIHNNNFGYDFDSIFGITPVKFPFDEKVLQDAQFKNGLEYKTLTNDFRNIFSNIFKTKINTSVVVKYDHDIDLSEIPEGGYFLIRDSLGDVYVIRYTTNGEFLESELQIDAMQNAVEMIDIFNKYGTKRQNAVEMIDIFNKYGAKRHV